MYIKNKLFRPGGFAIRCSLSIRIYNPPYNYPLCRSRIENPNTQTIGLQIRLNGASGKNRHAEVTILDYAKKHNLTLVSVAASRAVCGSCAKELDAANVNIISKRKKTCND